jgi:hypothetical protein
MDAATSTEFSAMANDDIAAAEVIIMTVRGNQPWPVAFRHWKAGSDQSGAVSPHAIIVLIEAADEQPAASDSWNSVLRSAATQIHPEVFVYEEKSGSDQWSSHPLQEFDAVAN